MLLTVKVNLGSKEVGDIMDLSRRIDCLLRLLSEKMCLAMSSRNSSSVKVMSWGQDDWYALSLLSREVEKPFRLCE